VPSEFSLRHRECQLLQGLVVNQWLVLFKLANKEAKSTTNRLCNERSFTDRRINLNSVQSLYVTKLSDMQSGAIEVSFHSFHQLSALLGPAGRFVVLIVTSAANPSG
jgi:hypothetical protein